jgi:hypothetical protein
MRIRWWIPLPGPFALTSEPGRKRRSRPKLRAYLVVGFACLLIFATGQVKGWW